MTDLSRGRPGRNEPCHCGSGRKYKQCCLEQDDAKALAAQAEAEAAAAAAAVEPAEATGSAPARPPKHQTQQPWRTRTSRGFVPPTRTPRKVGGS